MNDQRTDKQEQLQDEIAADLASLINQGLVVEIKPGQFQIT